MTNLEYIVTPNGTFKVNDRVWIVDKFGPRSGTVTDTSQWHCKPHGAPEYMQPFIKVQYDEKFDPFNLPNFAKTEAYFWRPDELQCVHHTIPALPAETTI